jgi:hypothetical protein
MLLWSALGDLESVLGKDRVAGVGAATDLAAVGTMAEDLAIDQNDTLPEYGLPTLASLLPWTS